MPHNNDNNTPNSLTSPRLDSEGGQALFNAIVDTAEVAGYRLKHAEKLQVLIALEEEFKVRAAREAACQVCDTPVNLSGDK